jgi:hypothetical protein
MATKNGKAKSLNKIAELGCIYVPNTLGQKAAKQNSIMCGDLELLGLHPRSCLYAQSIIGETLAFTEWVSSVLKENTKYPVRSCWSESVRNLERDLSE